jgi:hypothetical protein
MEKIEAEGVVDWLLLLLCNLWQMLQSPYQSLSSITSDYI